MLLRASLDEKFPVTRGEFCEAYLLFAYVAFGKSGRLVLKLCTLGLPKHLQLPEYLLMPCHAISCCASLCPLASVCLKQARLCLTNVLKLLRP